MAEWSLSKILLTAVTVVVLSLLAAGLYIALKLWPMGGDVPRQKTPAWGFKDLNEYKHELMLRPRLKLVARCSSSALTSKLFIGTTRKRAGLVPLAMLSGKTRPAR